ncbi:MAG: anaerobic ribonucleoside-triphosphate reductase [Candidatus Brocadiia bacterium]
MALDAYEELKDEDVMKTSTKIQNVRKRDGRLVPFDQDKIADAIFKAAQSVGGEDRVLAEELAGVVTMFLEKNYADSPPHIEEIQDTVEKVLIEMGHARTAKAYILYRDRRSRIREALRVRKPVHDKNSNSTDISLLVNTQSQDELQEWDKARIAKALEVEADLPEDIAAEVASVVEKRVLDSGMTRISTSLIRELVDNELFERGLTGRLEKQKVLGMPKYDLDTIIKSKSNENANIAQNNPEAINLSVAETTLKQYALSEVFSDDIAEAHMLGKVHVHDLGYPTRVYCSSHSLEYLKKYGLDLENLDSSSAPAKHARTLTGHLNTFLASMQAYYAGALGVGYINIFYAPYLEGMSYEEMKQEAQHLIFSSSQNAFSRGGQTLFLDFNIHTGVPSYLADIPAIGPGGEYTGRNYKSYEKTAQRFCKAMLDVWREGDRYGNIFAFPKCDFHISQDTLTDPAQREILEYTAKIASENGVPYFVFDRDEVTLSACCRLRTVIQDDRMIRHPETMRFCGFQNVTINLPQCAYRVDKGDYDGLYREIDEMIELGVKAHRQKRAFISTLMSSPEMPLWQIGKTAKDGRPYVDLSEATYILGLMGLNECLQHISGQELHESEEMVRRGLHVVRHMQFKAKQLGEKYDMRIALEESPAESAARRLAKVDLRRFPEEARATVKGEIGSDEMYYTNSIHMRADAPMDLLTRIRKQSKFHRAIESGAIIHAFVGEERPPALSILNLVEKTFQKTQAAQLTISPEFTVCHECHKQTPGLQATCGACGSSDVHGLTRIVGYFSRVNNWNKSKHGELKDRQKGNYSVSLSG